MANQIFAKRLKEALERRGFKQVDLLRIAQEEGIKIGKSHISQYVSGKTFPRADTLRFLAKALQVEEEWLCGRDVQILKQPTLVNHTELIGGKQCVNLRNRQNWIMFYMMLEVLWWKKRHAWKKTGRRY